MTQGRFEGLGPAGQEMPSPDLNHDLRTFLHSIIGYIELIQEDASAQGYDDLAPELEKIWMASNDLAALVEERSPDNSKPYAISGLEPTSVSREDAGKWLRDRVFAPSQQQV